MTLASDAQRIFRAGVSAVEPGRAVRANLRRRGVIVGVGTHALRVGAGGTVRIVAIGKAAGAMVDAATQVVGRPHEAIAVPARGYPVPGQGSASCSESIPNRELGASVPVELSSGSSGPPVRTTFSCSSSREAARRSPRFPPERSAPQMSHEPRNSSSLPALRSAR